MQRIRLWFLTYFGLLFREVIYYLCGSESLPPPLTPEEEQSLLERLAAGDTKVRTLLIEHNLRLVVYIARKFSATHLCVEDLFSIGSIGLIKAVNTFDVSKKIKLATYASRCIENEILMVLRRASKLKSERSLEEPLFSDQDGNQVSLADLIGTADDVVYKTIEDQVYCTILKQIVQELEPRDRAILEQRFGLNGHSSCTQKHVAQVIGISQSYISRLEKRILGEIQNRFEQMA
ncbi:MAG: hypothetical protein RLZ12_64 [Bacillota bacterium]|jgi:RNA polymerase sporulation-specific sigma factor